MLLLLQRRPLSASIRSQAQNSKRVPINELPSVSLPNSMDEAVAEAAGCIKTARGATSMISKAKAKTKGFSSSASASPLATSSAASQGSLVTAVEIPADTSSQALALLACQLAKKLSPSKLILVADQQVINECKGKGHPFTQCIGIQEACRQEKLGGVPLLTGLKVEDVALAEQLLSEVELPGSQAIFLNCDFTGHPKDFAGFVDQINVVWSFRPVEFSLGLLGKKEGAVLKRSDASDPTSGDWKVLYLLLDRFVQVGKSKTRPTIDEVENLVINASAAMSQVTQGVGNAVRGLKQGLTSILPSQNKT
jgi:hypothetical protein